MNALGRNVLVTGATGGLGQAIARALGQQGASLILTGRRGEVLEPLAFELDARAIVADLAERSDLERLIGEVGRVDILVANAALPASGTLDDYSTTQIGHALDVNLRAPIVLAKALMSDMAARRSGHLVFIWSLSGKLATPGSALYSATKFGLRGFAASLRQDLHGSGVGVSTIFPGPIREAGMWAQTQVELPRMLGTRRPQDVAAAVVRAIETDKAEIDVAPLPARLGAVIAAVAPTVVAGVNRRLGAQSIAHQVASAQREMR